MANTTPSMPFANLPQYPQMLFMLLFMGYGFGMPYPLGAAVPGVAVPSMVSMPTLLPPFPPPTTADCTIAEFCEKYKLGEVVGGSRIRQVRVLFWRQPQFRHAAGVYIGGFQGVGVKKAFEGIQKAET
jgi:hypothetical protein